MPLATLKTLFLLAKIAIEITNISGLEHFNANLGLFGFVLLLGFWSASAFAFAFGR